MTDILERTAFDFDLAEQQFNDAPMCESSYCTEELDKPPHPADWWAIARCGDITAICDVRRILCRRMGGWWCRPGCGHHHSYRRIRFDRITPR